MGSIQLRFALEEYSMTPADKETFPLSAAALLVDCEKQPGSFGLYISFPCGKPEEALSGFNIGAIYAVLGVWAGSNCAAARRSI